MNAESTPKCPQCGAPLPPDAPDGLCPKCVMALNLKTETIFSAESAPPHAPLTPEQIAPHFPQLEILEYLGRGGMGVVYKARQKSLNRLVALKLLAPERVHDAEFAARFTREAQALAALNHPNIVTIHDFGRADLPVGLGSEAAQQHRPTEAIYYFVMEFVDGVNLRHLLRARKFTPEEALTIVPPLCDALQYAHERGIVHRDIKPENILLAKDGRVKVADFGIAKIVGTDRGSVSRSGDDDSNGIGSSQTRMSGNVAAGHSPAVQDLTEAHQTFGTPGYSAPEQKADPQRVDSRADIYSLGVVFYEMLTGELPGKRIEPPSKKVHIDVRLDEIVLRALESKPELRYQQASVLKTQVETIAETPRSSGRRSAQNENGKQSIDLRVRTEVVVGWVAIIGSLAVILYQLRWVFSNKPPRADFLEQMIVPALVLIAGISSMWAGRRKTLSSNGDAPSAGQSQSRLTSAATELPEAKRPWQLIAVALVFIAVGIPSIYNLGKSIAYGSLPIGADTGLLHIPIGVGLLRLRPWWRKTAMFLLLLIASVFVIGGLFALSGLELAAPRGAVVFGYWIKSELAGGFINLLMLILITWQYLVLVRPDAKALFNKRGFDRPMIEWTVLLLAVAGSAGLALATQPLRDATSTPVLAPSVGILVGLTGMALIGSAIFMILRVSRPASKKPDARALAAIDAWLALMDKRDYAGTWEAASPLFRRVVSESEWVDKCVKVRKPLGNVIARELKTSRSAFFGKHFKAQFATRFDGGFDAVETVTFSHQRDGSWKALTYIVRIGTQLARDWKVAFWIVFATMLFASLFGTGINLAVKRATEERAKPVLSGVSSNPIVAELGEPGERSFVFQRSTLPAGWTPYDKFMKDGYLARGKTIKELIERVWSQENSTLKIVIQANLPDEKYDVTFGNYPQWPERLQKEIDERFGLVEEHQFLNGAEVVLVKKRNVATRGYTIERGDTAVRIARRFGMTISELKALNPDLNWNQLRVGREARVYGEEPVGAETNTAARITNNSARHEFEFRWVAGKDDTNLPILVLITTRTNEAGLREHYNLLRDGVVISDRDVESAGFSDYKSAQKTLEIFLQPEARERFAKATAQNIGRQLAIIWRSNVISAPIIQSALPGGRVQIMGSFSDSEAKELLDLLNHRVSQAKATNSFPTFIFGMNDVIQSSIIVTRTGGTNDVRANIKFTLTDSGTKRLEEFYRSHRVGEKVFYRIGMFEHAFELDDRTSFNREGFWGLPEADAQKVQDGLKGR